MFFKQININVDSTVIDYRLGTIGWSVCVYVGIDRDTLWLIPNRCYPSREWIVISNRRTRHKAQYECDMMHGRVCSLSRSPLWPDCTDAPFAIGDSAHVAYITYITLVAGDASAVESDPISFACSKSNYLQPTLSLPSAPVNNEFGRQQRGNERDGSTLGLAWLAGRLVGWLVGWIGSMNKEPSLRERAGPD